MYWIQNGTPKLIGYVSKRLLPAAENCSLTELELKGLYVNIIEFNHLLAKVDFVCTVDHLALTYIMESKTEPASTRIKLLLRVLSDYPFNLYYVKGKNMTLSNFLPRIKVDKSSCHEIISI